MFSMLKGLGLGAGAMYYFDPEAGEQRRAALADQFAGVGKQVEEWLGHSTQDLKSQAQEYVDDANIPVNLDALNPTTWPPAAWVAGGVLGAMVGLKLMRKMPLATLALGAVGVGIAMQKMSKQGDWKNLASDGDRREFGPAGGHGYSVRSPAFDQPHTSSSLTSPPAGSPAKKESGSKP